MKALTNFVGAFYLKGCVYKMAYQGYLLKTGNYIFPLELIRAETYEITKNEQDLDSYTDASGELHRNALEHWVVKIEFEVIGMLDNIQLAQLWANLQNNYLNSTEKCSNLEFYLPELDSYITQKAYIPTVSTPMSYVDHEKIVYQQVRFAFIGY